MKTSFLAISAFVLLSASGRSANDYPPGPDSQPHDGVPKGELIKFSFDQSKIFPGTTRDVTIYVPHQYNPATPACVYVNQDGVQWNAPVVFDNLIQKGEMPVTIGIFVTPGLVKALDANTALDRFNRSYEYDGLGDAYARFLLEEIIPAVEAKKTGDDRPIHLSQSGNDRAIGGSSSGAICAFTAAWERPDAFARVFSAIGTYVGLRGGDRYPTLIRKYEPKRLRIFLQDGSGDQNIYAGDWWMANQTMQRALAFAGYEHTFVWGDGTHSGKHGTALFPDAMRFLWKDWPAPVKAGEGSQQLKDILLPGEGWQLVWENGKSTEGPASDSQGILYFNDVPALKTYRLGADGVITELATHSNRRDGMACGPDGSLYAAWRGGVEKIAFVDGKETSTMINETIQANDLVVRHDGSIYVTEPGWDGTTPSNIWLIRADGTALNVDTGLKFANGLTLSPDQSLLYVSDTRSHWVYSYQIAADGTLANKQRYYWLHEPDTVDDSGADGMDVDANGRLYVASRLGIQVCDQPGRVNCIIPTPNGRVSNVVFGGAAFDTLFATCGGKVYKRKLKVKGAPRPSYS